MSSLPRLASSFLALALLSPAALADTMSDLRTELRQVEADIVVWQNRNDAALALLKSYQEQRADLQQDAAVARTVIDEGGLQPARKVKKTLRTVLPQLRTEFPDAALPEAKDKRGVGRLDEKALRSRLHSRRRERARLERSTKSRADRAANERQLLDKEQRNVNKATKHLGGDGEDIAPPALDAEVLKELRALRQRVDRLERRLTDATKKPAEPKTKPRLAQLAEGFRARTGKPNLVEALRSRKGTRSKRPRRAKTSKRRR